MGGAPHAHRCGPLSQAVIAVFCRSQGTVCLCLPARVNAAGAVRTIDVIFPETCEPCMGCQRTEWWLASQGQFTAESICRAEMATHAQPVEQHSAIVRVACAAVLTVLAAPTWQAAVEPARNSLAKGWHRFFTGAGRGLSNVQRQVIMAS